VAYPLAKDGLLFELLVIRFESMSDVPPTGNQAIKNQGVKAPSLDTVNERKINRDCYFGVISL
jgi:hypothetical protein